MKILGVNQFIRRLVKIAVVFLSTNLMRSQSSYACIALKYANAFGNVKRGIMS